MVKGYYVLIKRYYIMIKRYYITIKRYYILIKRSPSPLPSGDQDLLYESKLVARQSAKL